MVHSDFSRLHGRNNLKYRRHNRTNDFGKHEEETTFSLTQSLFPFQQQHVRLTCCLNTPHSRETDDQTAAARADGGLAVQHEPVTLAVGDAGVPDEQLDARTEEEDDEDDGEDEDDDEDSGDEESEDDDDEEEAEKRARSRSTRQPSAATWIPSRR